MALNEQTVLAYVQQRPEFLQTHAQTLGIRADESKILSFNQGSLNVLKQKTERMAAQLAQMLDDAERNRSTTAKLLAFNHRLLAANTVGQLAQACSDSLSEDFALPHHVLKIVQAPANKARIPQAVQAADNSALKKAWGKLSAPQCGQHLPEPVAALLAKSPPLGSFLQLPVWRDDVLLAVLLIGHEDADYFHADLETDLVAEMAQSLSVALGRMMGLAA